MSTSILVKALKVDLSEVKFKNPEKVCDGANGRLLESEMRKQGFPIDSSAIVDLPGVNSASPGVEVKSRSKTSGAMHTVGTMTYENIIKTPWSETSFNKKLQQQWRVTLSNNVFTDKVSADGSMVDLTHPNIQELFEEAYEDCRAQLATQGGIISGQTIKGGQYGALEHKPGRSGNAKSYAMRIPNSGMKKVIKEATSTFHKLFDLI